MSKPAKSDLGSVPIDELPLAQLERMAAAGAEVVDCRRVLTKTGDNIVGELLRASFFVMES